MTATRHHQLTVNGHTIHARTHGTGHPLLLHAGMFSRMDDWTPLLDHLDGFQPVTYDAPGVGDSPPPRGPMSMRELAAVGAGVLDQLGIASAHVLGASFGGAVAQQMARDCPRRVDRLVLVSTSFGGLAMPGHPLAMLGLAGQAGRGSPASPRAVMLRMSALAGWTSMHWLHRITHPTLLLCGDNDQVTPLFNHRVMEQLIPDALLHVVPGTGHLMLLQNAAEAGRVITRFLAGAAGKTAEAA